MTRHRHHRRKPDDSDHAASAARFKERLRINTEAAGLPDTPSNRQRIEDCTWIDLAMDAVRAAILRGEAVEVTAIERLVAARNAILPQANELIVKFIDTPLAETEREELRGLRRKLETIEKAKGAVKIPSEHLNPADPAVPENARVPEKKPTPSNVTPLKPKLDYAPARNSDGSIRTGIEPLYTPPGRGGRCFGDIPETF